MEDTLMRQIANCSRCYLDFNRVDSVSHDENGSVVATVTVVGDKCEPCGGTLTEDTRPFYEYVVLPNGFRHLRRKTV
jgi:N-formylglutamate amidohydrolase